MKFIKLLTGVFTLTAGLLAHAQAQSFITNGLAAYYPFNGNANDASGNGNDGTNFGGISAVDRYGIKNTAINFSNINVVNPNMANCLRTDIPVNIIPTAAGTISAWINPFKITYGAILARNHPAMDGASFTFGGYSQEGVGWVASGTPGMLYFHPSNGSINAASTNLIMQGIWQQVTVTYSSAQCSFFINGSLAGTTLGNFSVPADDGTYGYPTTCCIGALLTDATNIGVQQWTDGNIDDVRIYNRALSAAEVQQLYAYESKTMLTLIKAVKPSFSNLYLGTNYQLQVSGDLTTWTNQGSAFIATTNNMVYPQYWDVDNWSKLFFRLQVAP